MYWRRSRRFRQREARRRPRPQQLRFHGVAVRQRHQRRPDVRCHRRIRLPGRREPGARARPARDDHAIAGVRSHDTHVPPCRPRFQADRRARPRGAGDYSAMNVGWLVASGDGSNGARVHVSGGYRAVFAVRNLVGVKTVITEYRRKSPGLSITHARRNCQLPTSGHFGGNETSFRPDCICFC